MTAEIDELDEINLGPDRTSRPDGRTRQGRIGMGAARDRFNAKPKWMKQLRCIKGREESQKLKAKVIR